jgi:hypothetical protein
VGVQTSEWRFGRARIQELGLRAHTAPNPVHREFGRRFCRTRRSGSSLWRSQPGALPPSPWVFHKAIIPSEQVERLSNDFEAHAKSFAFIHKHRIDFVAALRLFSLAWLHASNLLPEVAIVTDTDHLEAALQQLLQERDELDGVIAGLQKRLGKFVPDSISPIPPAKALYNPASIATGVVYRGAFFNLSVTKAAEKLLKTYGKPLKTPEILAAFLQAEYEGAKGENARSGIYTALARSKDFVKVLPDTWDLAERHPEAAEKKTQELAAKKSKPARRGRPPKGTSAKAELKPTVVGEVKVA